MSFMFVFQVLILIFSAVVHEIAHGFVARELGDKTAEQAGRLTLNPLKHIDPFGSVILPLILSLIPGGIILGWAKPVPYNPLNLKNPKNGGAMIAAAGPLSNLFIAIVFSGLFRLLSAMPEVTAQMPSLLVLFTSIIAINLMLCIFNLIPIPPLDGSKILFMFFTGKMQGAEFFLERYGFFLLLLFVFFGVELLSPIVIFIFKLLVGL